MPIPEFTLRDFNRVASGEYNAGQIDFATGENGQVSLTKVNNRVRAMLDKVFSRDVEGFLTAEDRTSLTRQFASIQLYERTEGDADYGAILNGNYNTETLVMNAIVEDAQKMGGDKSYKIDIGI